MQYDWRAPQAVTQAGIADRSGFLLQLAMQIFCSPLQRMGTANAIWLSNATRLKRTAAATAALCCAKMILQSRPESESIVQPPFSLPEIPTKHGVG
jgi:hypothetical protein